jgi:hypothetical protein
MFGSKEFKGDITVTSVTDSLPSQAASPTRVRYASELSTARKIFICATVILINFNVTLGSSLPSGAGAALNAHFGVTSELEKPLPVAIFLVGYSESTRFCLQLPAWTHAGGNRPVT